MVSTLLLLVAIVLLCWAPFNFLGWWIWAGSEGDPFNWRVLVGPWSYYPWLDRQGDEE